MSNDINQGYMDPAVLVKENVMKALQEYRLLKVNQIIKVFKNSKLYDF